MPLPPELKTAADTLRARLMRIEVEIENGARSQGMSPVAILPVTKGHSAEAARVAVAAGLTSLGENYLQECRAKDSAVGSGTVSWHLLGHLQRNKVAAASHLFGVVETVDSLRLAEAISTARRGETPLPILWEVDMTTIPGRTGFRPEQLRRDAEAMVSLPGITVSGLMTVASPDLPRRCFEGCRQLRDELEAALGVALPELSMGMSGDYLAAVREGSTQIRLGTALFGPRVGQGERA